MLGIMADNLSLYDVLRLPDPLRIGFVTVLFIFTLSILLGERDLGFIKIPAFPNSARRWIKCAVPALLLLSLLAFIPLFDRSAEAVAGKATLHLVADDLTLGLENPYEHRPPVTTARVRVEVFSGSAILSRKAEILSQQVDKGYFADGWPEVELVSAKPDRLIVSKGESAVITMEFDTYGLIPRASYSTNWESYVGRSFGNIRVEIQYSVRDKEKKTAVDIPMRFTR
jgi:hypothetical protein